MKKFFPSENVRQATNHISQLNPFFKIRLEVSQQWTTYPLIYFQANNSFVKSMSLSHTQTFLLSSLYLTSFQREIQWYYQKFKKIHVNVPQSHLSLQCNFKRNTLWNNESISHCNDESVEPTSSNEAIFNIGNRYFWHPSALKRTYFSIPEHVKYWAPQLYFQGR